jgi:hypothetical protein
MENGGAENVNLKENQIRIVAGGPIAAFVVFVPSVVVAAGSALAAGSVAHVFVGAFGVPVVGADFPPVAELSAVVSDASARGAVIPAVAAAALAFGPFEVPPLHTPDLVT